MEYYDYILSGAHKAYREPVTDDLATAYAAEGLSPIERVTRRFTLLCDRQAPHIRNGRKFPKSTTSTSLATCPT